jgi:hypothetical protein
VSVTYIKRDINTGVETRITTYRTSSYVNERPSNPRVNQEDSKMATSNYSSIKIDTPHNEHLDEERRFVSNQLLSHVEDKRDNKQSNNYLSRISEEDSVKEKSQYSNVQPQIIRYEYGQPQQTYSHFSNDNRSKRELYVAPLNYTELRNSVRRNTPDKVIESRLSKLNNEVSTYNYECYTEAGTNTRKYVLKRNPTKSFLQSNAQHSHCQTQKNESNITGQSVSSFIIDDEELSKRYNGLELREENPKYKVYRVVSPNQLPRLSTSNQEQRASITRPGQTYTIRRNYPGDYNMSR